ncbi:helix-turn-helix domain-containing protein [Corynebacterium hindlerae]|uniref:helix-turn-helix domain-containing protein n=1 Tax=Corynebacterium TaxID=1716 RepID=UPI00054D8838|nr:MULTISPECIES: helix-turn-helix domain-containing protein [Corynebacterium]QTH59264.1 helix-turn-helix domain-containing protein [Corynebacterium hindlerae]
MSDQFEFGRFVSERRKQHEYTMRRFADMIGVTAPYLSDIEKGRRAAPDGKLEEIATALKLSRAEREQMFDLAALTRENQVSADLSGYIMETDLARVALRRAKEQDLSDRQWENIINIIEGGDSN